MKRHISALSLMSGLLLLTPAAGAGDVKTAEQSLRYAVYALESHQWQTVDQRLAEAEKALDGLDDATATPLTKQIADLRDKRNADERDMRATPLMRELDRNLDGAEREFEESTRGDGNAEVADQMEYYLSRVEERLKTEECQTWLSEADRAERVTRIKEMRAKGEAARRDILFKRADKWLVKIEDLCAGKSSDDVTRDGVEQWFEYAKDGIAKLPADDARYADLQARVAKDRTAYDKLIASADHDEFVEQVTKFWTDVEGAYGASSTGWEREDAPSYADWLTRGELGAKKTEERYHLLHRLIDTDEYQRAKQELAGDERIAALIQEVDGSNQAVGDKLCAMATDLVAHAEQDHDSAPDRLTTPLKRLAETLERLAGGAKSRAATLERINGLVTKIETAEAGRVAALEGARKKGVDAANAAWPALAESAKDAVAIDPVACVESFGDWKGKTVVFQQTRNRAGWDFEWADYDFITPVHGVPVAGQFDERLRAAIHAAEEASGLRFNSGDIEGVVGVIDQACRVQGIEYSQLLKEHVPTANYKAPLLRITAVKAGPFALAVDAGGKLSGSAPAKASDATAGGAGGSASAGSADTVSAGQSSGGGWLWLLLIGAVCAVGFLRRRQLHAWLTRRYPAAATLTTRAGELVRARK